jgi:cephalosporin hydroxylase
VCDVPNGRRPERYSRGHRSPMVLAMGRWRSRIARAGPVTAVRASVALAAAPILRHAIARTSHRQRLEWVRLLVPGSHGQRRDEILSFARFASKRSPGSVCEIGTLMGGTSLFLTGLAPSVRKFVGIDIQLRNARLVAALAPSWVDVRHIEGSSREPAVNQRLAEELAGKPLDILFIDGDHSYEGVRSDFLEYRDVVSAGGLIAFHDIIDDRGGDFWAGGVPRFWRQINNQFRCWEFVDDYSQDAYGIGVVEHDPTVDFTL